MAETTNGKFDDYVHEETRNTQTKFNAADHFGNVPNSEHPRDLDQHPGVTADIRPVGQETSITFSGAGSTPQRTTHDIAVSSAERVIHAMHEAALSKLLAMRNEIDEVIERLTHRRDAMVAELGADATFLQQAHSMERIFADALRQLRQGLERKAV